jgi:hypothetical protein
MGRDKDRGKGWNKNLSLCMLVIMGRTPKAGWEHGWKVSLEVDCKVKDRLLIC